MKQKINYKLINKLKTIENLHGSNFAQLRDMSKWHTSPSRDEPLTCGRGRSKSKVKQGMRVRKCPGSTCLDMAGNKGQRSKVTSKKFFCVPKSIRKWATLLPQGHGVRVTRVCLKN